MSLKLGAALEIQTGLSSPEPAGLCSFGPALELEPPPRNAVGEGSRESAAQWGWSPGVCSSQQEWAPPWAAGVGEHELWHPGTGAAAGTPHGTAPLEG